jgi:prepilin-type processing-associated H-X9-DG protein
MRTRSKAAFLRNSFHDAARIHCRAMTLVELMVIVAVLALLAAWLFQDRAYKKAKAQRIACVGRLKQTSLSFRIWAHDNTNAYPMSLSTNFGGTREFSDMGEFYRHFQVMSNELNVALLLACPADRLRRPALSWAALSNSNVSYFIGLDADENWPQAFLAGDSNLEVDGKPVGPGLLNLWTNSAVGWTAERHVRQGNVALADGSVYQFSNARFREELVNTGVATNRLAIP